MAPWRHRGRPVVVRVARHFMGGHGLPRDGTAITLSGRVVQSGEGNDDNPRGGRSALPVALFLPPRPTMCQRSSTGKKNLRPVPSGCLQGRAWSRAEPPVSLSFRICLARPAVAPISIRCGLRPTAGAGRRGVDYSVPCFYFFPRASIAASTFGGDIGSSVSRRPIARSIALAMAAMGGQMLTSAAPLAP
jgi:hypothetical protein